MKKHLPLQILIVVGLTLLLPFIAVNTAFAQEEPYNEEYKQQKEDGDMAEY